MALVKKCCSDNSGQTAPSARHWNVQSCSCLVKNYAGSVFTFSV